MWYLFVCVLYIILVDFNYLCRKVTICVTYCSSSLAGFGCMLIIVVSERDLVSVCWFSNYDKYLYLAT